MLAANKHVVVTGSISYNELSGIEPRLQSYLDGGLSVKIGSPDLEMRVTILLHGSDASNIRIPKEVAYFIAVHVERDIRSLLGARKRVEDFAVFHNRPITLDLAREALGDSHAVE